MFSVSCSTFILLIGYSVSNCMCACVFVCMSVSVCCVMYRSCHTFCSHWCLIFQCFLFNCQCQRYAKFFMFWCPYNVHFNFSSTLHWFRSHLTISICNRFYLKCEHFACTKRVVMVFGLHIITMFVRFCFIIILSNVTVCIFWHCDANVRTFRHIFHQLQSMNWCLTLHSNRTRYFTSSISHNTLTRIIHVTML